MREKNSSFQNNEHSNRNVYTLQFLSFLRLPPLDAFMCLHSTLFFTIFFHSFFLQENKSGEIEFLQYTHTILYVHIFFLFSHSSLSNVKFCDIWIMPTL